ncbi:MAG: M15 family metallopeptidase [Candidatus Pseudobacter hemicellulosilyticus]|uniref:D-alanyl-D-alanine dipeptidase n=1 Tax=Candidatus Pseudobacter hemicellulosilyticus TaxID=3121375 RepID=A0AAJ6BE49_9BACT|nr:MAG: M15 family metallopeptidase [Pseudobacter sp.]
MHSRTIFGLWGGWLLSALFALLAPAVSAQSPAAGPDSIAAANFARYRLPVISDPGVYKEMVARDSAQELVSLVKAVPGIRLDIRYATDNNIMKRPVYRQAVAYARKPVAAALKKVQAALAEQGLGLQVFDAYRPYRVTVVFYEAFRDSVFVASPYRGSRHNRGCAVDLTLVNGKTGRPLEMPTPYDEFSKRAHSDYRPLPANQLRNRELLKKLMTENGFLIYPDEWWHFDFSGWQQFPLMDIPFHQL